ncbi:MAG: hypothetical protein ACI90V_004520 [Bacillariaceae sp.]|jgi:hypothetical protein
MTSKTMSEKDDNTESESDNKSSRARLRCMECKEKISLYQCPACQIRTCSLQCCQAHKKRTGCIGKRNRSVYLPLCRMNDNTLQSDYFFIEEVLEIMPRASKISKLAEENSISTNTSTSTINNNRSIASLNKKARRLVNQAKNRGITLQVMPGFLERHKNNTSWYCGPRDNITWKVEIIIMPTNKTFSIQLSEKEENILDCITKHIVEFHKDDSDIPSTLSGSNYQLFTKRLPSSAKNPKYVQIENSVCLKKALNGLTIIEHPTIYCVPNDNLEDFPIGTEKITEEKTDIIIPCTEQGSTDTPTTT